MPITTETGITATTTSGLSKSGGITAIVSAGGGGSTLPTQSIDFESTSTQYLSMTDANFGAFDRAKFAISVWVKRESTLGDQAIIRQTTGAGNHAFYLLFESSAISFYTYANGTALDGGISTTATYTSTASWYHILVWYDSANATAGDRIRLWVNGTEVTAFSFDDSPSAAVFDSTSAVQISSDGTLGLSAFDGLMYQFAFFSGTLPAVDTLYNAGSPKTVVGMTGLYAYLDVAGGSVVSDGVLTADWTNNGGAVASSTVPV